MQKATAAAPTGPLVNDHQYCTLGQGNTLGFFGGKLSIDPSNLQPDQKVRRMAAEGVVWRVTRMLEFSRSLL